MRISAAPHSPYYHHLALDPNCEVYLGGEKVKHCVEACEEGGWVKVHSDVVGLVPGTYLNGNVEIKMPDEFYRERSIRRLCKAVSEAGVTADGMAEIMSKINEPNIEKGDHFWATMQDKIVVMMKNENGKYYVCGAWASPIKEREFEFIEFIKMPKGYNHKELYY